jgi:hypothetical protein
MTHYRRHRNSLMLAGAFLGATSLWGCGSNDDNPIDIDIPTEQECLAECGEACPAPELQPCASNGQRYCNECVIACYGLSVASDSSTCETENNGDGPNNGDTNNTDPQPTNAAPQISTLYPQVLGPQQTTGRLAFTVSDAETAADELTVTARSLHADIISQGQITLAGSGADRTIEIVAGANAGTATIEISVSDGELTTTTTFNVTVNDFCPLMYFECAVGCCPSTSHIVSERRADFGALDIDGQGNVYMTFALPASTEWSTGLTVYRPTTGTWSFDTMSPGNQRPSISVSPSGKVHHLYGGDRTVVHYRSSDDQGHTWDALTSPTQTLDSGGTCALTYTVTDLPHLLCGMSENVGDRGTPRYFQWDGTQWSSQLTNFRARMYGGTTMHLGVHDRPHIVHTSDTTGAGLNYTYFTDRWVTEAIPFPEGLRIASVQDGIDFVLTARDTVHVAATLYSSNPVQAQVWYFVRTLNPSTGVGEWTSELVIAPSDFLRIIAGNAVSLDLGADGAPVIFNNQGTGAYRHADGTWRVTQTRKPVQDVAVHQNRAYILFPVEGAQSADQRMHLSVIDLNF